LRIAELDRLPARFEDGSPVRLILTLVAGLATAVLPETPLDARVPTKAAAGSSNGQSSLLLLYSGRIDLPANVAADRSIRDTLAQAPQEQVAIFSEYIDLRPLAEEEYASALRDFSRGSTDGTGSA
jgi:hypothetical protein